METKIKQITLDEIYVSVLQARRVARADGWERLEPVDKRLPRTGSLIMDAVAAILITTSESTSSGVARRLGVRQEDLNGAMNILTGMPSIDFIRLYRMRQIKEWLACTDLPINEIVRRSPCQSAAALSRLFSRKEGLTLTGYRRKHRPRNFRELYRW